MRDATPFRVHFRRQGGTTPTKEYRSPAVRRWAMASPHVHHVEDLDQPGTTTDGGDPA